VSNATRRGALAAVLAGAMGACTDAQPSAPLADPIDMAAAVATGPCSLLRDITSDARSYFPQPERRTAQDIVQAMGTDCKNGLQAGLTARAWQLLGMVEAVLEGGRGGDLATGSSLVNGLLGCTGSLCEFPPSPFIDFSGALASGGLFAVRSQSTDPAVSRDPVQFTDLRGTLISAFWGVEVDQPWAQVTFADPVLVYGRPLTSNGVPLSDAAIGNIQYELNVYPDAGEFLDGALHVGACFSPEAVFDDGTNPLEPRMQREQVLLEEHVPGFCSSVFTPVQSASLFGSLFALAKDVAQPLLSLFVMADRSAPAVGGTPLDFSRFAPVAANTNARLEFVSQPNPTPTESQPIGTFQVRARSGAGTPMEKVLVTVYIFNNQGVPAGAVLSGDLSAYTEERDGVQGIATFDNVIVGKPGGYTVCATGSLAGFTFAEACSNLFNVRNAN
jgi:hypothetical protein